MIEVSPQGKKVHVETWGCQMNVADSEQMLALLAEKNYHLTQRDDDADLIVLNTCHIREKARHKVLSRLGVLRDMKARRPGLKIAVAGCVAQADGKRLLAQAPYIDVLLGPGKIADLPRLIDENAASGTASIAVGFKREHEHVETPVAAAPVPSVTGKPEVCRFVNIIQGCNNFCTFCVVPHTRGREISRLPAEILAECTRFVETGAREITLLGQNVNSYGLDLVEASRLTASGAGPFVDLLMEVANIPGLERLRFTTSNPHDFNPALAELFRTQPKLGKYMHLPVQSGSDRILERMKRKVTRAEYLEKITWLRQAVPDMAISTDLIVGFPGETDEDFADTLSLVEQVKFSFIYAFKYSPRRNTPAARFTDQIPEAVMDERLAALNKLQDHITTQQNLAEVGAEREVLFFYESRKEPGIYIGRTPQFRGVRVESGRSLIGEILPVVITGGNKTALEASLI